MLAIRLVIGETVETIRTFRPTIVLAEMHRSAANFDCESSTVGSISCSAGGSVSLVVPESVELEQALNNRTAATNDVAILFARIATKANGTKPYS
jgi:hypothetical protein